MQTFETGRSEDHGEGPGAFEEVREEVHHDEDADNGGQPQDSDAEEPGRHGERHEGSHQGSLLFLFFLFRSK